MAIAEIALLLMALSVLAKAAQMVIDSSIKLADFFKISHVAVGFLLISVATSLPEFMVSVISSVQGQGGIAIGNVFGSNISDVLLILGLPALLYGIRPKMKEWKDVSLVLVVVSVVTVVLVYLAGLDKLEGFVLLLVFAIYALYMLRKKVDMDTVNHVNKHDALGAFLIFSISIALVLVSAGFTVELAVKLAEELGLAKSFIGATIIAIGTTLPELAVNIQATRKKEYGLALGDAIGSTMINLTLVLGVAALLNPIPLRIPIFTVFIAFSILANVVLFYFISVSKALNKKEGVIFLVLYLFYLVTIFYVQSQLKQDI